MTLGPDHRRDGAEGGSAPATAASVLAPAHAEPLEGSTDIGEVVADAPGASPGWGTPGGPRVVVRTRWSQRGPVGAARSVPLCRRFVEQLVAEALAERRRADPAAPPPFVDWSAIWDATDGIPSLERSAGRAVLLAGEEVRRLVADVRRPSGGSFPDRSDAGADGETDAGADGETDGELGAGGTAAVCRVVAGEAADDMIDVILGGPLDGSSSGAVAGTDAAIGEVVAEDDGVVAVPVGVASPEADAGEPEADQTDEAVRDHPHTSAIDADEATAARVDSGTPVATADRAAPPAPIAGPAPLAASGRGVTAGRQTHSVVRWVLGRLVRRFGRSRPG